MNSKRALSKVVKFHRKSLLLIGPRQVGKSTFLLSLKPDLVFNLASESQFLKYSSSPQLFEDEIAASPAKTIFIDEIQRIPGLLNSVQVFIDERKNKTRFLLSGSSARKLKRGQANLLPGRVLSFQMSGLSAAELNYSVNSEDLLKYGSLPGVYFEKSPQLKEKILKSYSAIYLKEEIQAETLTRNIQGFSRFLMTIAQASGHILDFSKISSKSKVSRSGITRFVEILEDTLIAERIYCFDETPEADTIQHPKLYFFDVGVLNGLLENFSTTQERKGILFEHLIYNQIRNSALSLDLPIQFYFFRTRHGLEVDFIVKLKNKVWAIEVKSGDVESRDLKSLKAFREYYPKVHKCVAVTLKSKKRISDGILVCNWIDLLKEMKL